MAILGSCGSIPTDTHTQPSFLIGENVKGKEKREKKKKNSFLFCSVRALSPEDLDISKRNTHTLAVTRVSPPLDSNQTSPAIC